jgi:hypothetical protein
MQQLMDRFDRLERKIDNLKAPIHERD